MKCKNCYYYKKESDVHGTCDHKKLDYLHECRFVLKDSQDPEDYFCLTPDSLGVVDCWDGWIEVGKDFGCVHFTAKAVQSAEGDK